MIKHPRRALTNIVLAGTLCASILSIPASAAAQPSTNSAPRADDRRSSITLVDELPWLLRRAALLDLRLQESPSPSDYELTANLLSLAMDIDPSNAELARELAQAAWLAGDESLMLEATRQVIRLDPRDSVAQLRLISARINTRQTVEERKALYDRFLGDAGQSLDPAVRSRLALDAALLEREMGNTAGFIERLHQATRMDITNKSAASLAAQYYSSVRENPVSNFDYQIRLLYADPVDANVHLSIAQMLASEGELEHARRFLDLATELYRIGMGGVPQNIEEIRIAIEWQIDGPRSFLDRLNPRLNEQRVKAQSVIDAYQKQALPTDDLIKPEEIRFTIEIDKMRLLAAHGQEDTELVRSVLSDIEASYAKLRAEIDQKAQARGANIRSLTTQYLTRTFELQAMRALVGQNAEKIRQDTQRIIDQQPAMAPLVGIVEPLALFAEGQYQDALDATESYADSPVRSLIRAQCFERLGRTEEAIDRYLRIARSNAMDVYGAYANTRLHALGSGDRLVTEAGKEMGEMAERVPNWVDQMIERPGSFHYISVTQDKPIYREGELPTLSIRIQNTAPIPLAMGPNMPIDSRVLIEPAGVKTTNNGFVGEPRPKVLQLDHRLRLEPREELVVRVVADSATTDWLIDQQPGVSMRQRWRLIQNYRPRMTDDADAARAQAGPDAPVFGIVSSPLGLTAETGIVQRLALTTFQASPLELIAMLKRGDPQSRRKAVLAINARLIRLNRDNAEAAQIIREIVAGLNDTFTAVSRKERAAMLLMLPHRHQLPPMIGFDDHVAAGLLSDALIDSKADPVLLACALITRTDDPEAPIFEALEHVNDRRVERIGEIVRSRLRNNEPMLGTVGPGVNAMTPSFDGLKD